MMVDAEGTSCRMVFVYVMWVLLVWNNRQLISPCYSVSGLSFRLKRLETFSRDTRYLFFVSVAPRKWDGQRNVVDVSGFGQPAVCSDPALQGDVLLLQVRLTSSVKLCDNILTGALQDWPRSCEQAKKDALLISFHALLSRPEHELTGNLFAIFFIAGIGTRSFVCGFVSLHHNMSSQ